MAKILRLRKQKKFLQRRRQDMMARGLRSLEELDATKQKEKEEKERVENERRQQHELLSTESFFPADHGPLDLDPAFDPGPEFWATLDAGGGTPQPS
jgi:hypothetical protein